MVDVLNTEEVAWFGEFVSDWYLLLDFLSLEQFTNFKTPYPLLPPWPASQTLVKQFTTAHA
jgi:hypothetical protein